jgi:hypothetical protein
MRPKMLNLIEDCISKGLVLGWNRAHKHEQNPPMEYIMQCLEEGIMYQLHEIFDFESKIE